MVFTGHPRRRGGHSNDDSIGNRKSPHEMDRNLPDDIGNRRGHDESGADTPDDLGNRLGGPAPWSRHFLRGKGKGGRGGKRSNASLKDMEQLYAAQGEGVPRHLRPGFRALATGEVAQLQADGSLKSTGMNINGDRVGGGPVHGGQDVAGGGQGGGEDMPFVEGEGRKKRRRRRKRGRDGLDGGVPGGQPQAQGQPGQPHAQQHHHGQGGAHIFEEDDDGFRYQLKSDPEDKRKAAVASTQEVLKHAGRDARVGATVYQETHGPRVVVEIKENDPQGPLFGKGTAALGAMTFLVNKIVNRYPDDRIRLSIVEEGTWVPQAVPPPAADGAVAAPAVAPAAPVAAAAAAAPAAPVPAAAPPAPTPAPAPAPVAAEEAEEEDEEEDGDEDEEGDEEGAEEGAEAAEGEAAAPARKRAAPKTTTRRTAAKKTTRKKAAAPRRTPR